MRVLNGGFSCWMVWEELGVGWFSGQAGPEGRAQPQLSLCDRPPGELQGAGTQGQADGRQVSASTCWQLLPWAVVEKCTKITQSAFLERETGAKAVILQYCPHPQVQLSRSNLYICSNLQP